MCAPFGVLAIVMGAVAFRTGWMIAPARRTVRRPRVYGVGAMVMGAGVLTSTAVYFAVRIGALPGPPWGALAGNALVFAGAAFVAASRLRPRHGQGPHGRAPRRAA
ncbi:hypothetical protein [Streptomyces litmocidini]|uniref:Integral membrane protein n=1 Tax=Streptomyces litmocidini TaxID=67318 RepID=A0ABW7U936_9ACTN